MTDAEIAEDYSTATWLGNSQIIINSNSGWYSAGGSGNTAFHGANLGTFRTETSLTMGGQIQTYGDNDAAGHVVKMNYSVYPSGSSASTWHSQDLAWYTYNNNNNWFGTSDGSSRPVTIDISTLPAGDHKLEVYFSQQTGADSWLYETYDVHNYVATFTIAATLTRSVASLTGFSTESGTASAAQSFTVTATHLNGNLTVTAPTGYEVSTSSGSGYAGSVTLSRDANNKVTGQTVYVRLKSDAAVGSRTGNVTVGGGGTTQVTVGLTGGVTPKPPTKGTVSYPSNEAEGRVVIPWTKNTAGNDVMVVRVANNGTAPSPANGTSYSQGGTLGSGQIVYKGNATSYKDTGLTAGTDYDYYLFSVSGNYYSTGVKVDATASKAPRFATSSVSKSTTVGGTASNTQTASGTPSSMTYSVTCTSGGATSGFSVNGSGVFSFAPTAAGTYVFTVSAANGVTAVSASSYTVTVTATAAAPTVGSPSRTGTTAVGATLGGTVSSTGGATVTEWGVVYSATSLNTDPTVGGTGCTNVTASGTPGESAFTAAVTGLKANTEYKWKAYAVNSVGTGYTAVQTFTTPCMSAGPVVTPTPGNGTATFTWADVGAVQYLLSLWTGSGSASSVTETFNSSTLSGSSYSGNTSITGGDLGTWTSTGARGDRTDIDGTRGPTLQYGKTLTSPALTIAFNTVSFSYYYPFSEASSGNWDMELYIGSTKVGTHTLSQGGAGTHGTITYTGLTGQIGDSIKIVNAGTGSNKRVLIDNITISGTSRAYVTGGTGGTAGTVGVEIHDLAVTSPVTVAGLTSGTTYNWSLTAVGGGTGCEEDGTPYGTNTYVVTPTAADVAPAWASTVGPWSATVSTLLSQDMTDYITAGSPAPTFTVTAQGTAPAGTYAVTSAGAFTFTPAEGDAGKSFVFRFTASNTQGSPTKDVTVTVGALAPTITENTKTIGTTSATLPITVNMRGGATTENITLKYGTTASGTQGSSATVSPTQITTGLNAGTSVSGSIASGLTPGVEYSYTWTVKNSAGTTTKTGTFTTLDVAPAVALSGSLNVTVNTGATATLAATGAGAWVTAGTHLTYTLSTTVSSSLYTWTAGTGTLAFRPTATGTYTFNLTASNGRGSATYAWTVTVANAPTITKGEASTSGTSATVPATIHAGGAATTVTFKYGTAEGTYNLNPASLSGGSVAAGATAAAASASLTGLTQGTTYYYQWTAVNAGGTTVETGSFFQPGDGLEFPGQMNGWAQSGTTTRDAEFGGGNYYYTPATRLTGDQLFKAYKGGTWYGNGDWVTGNNSGHVFTVNENTAENKLCVTETGGAFPPSGVGYYTLRGHDTGSGIEYVALYTENAPVTFTGASDNHAARGTADVTVTATLSGAKSTSEKVYLRYTTDGWTTSSLVQMSGSGTSYTGTIPGQGKGTTVEWYVLTSPHDAVADHVDLCTLRGLKNGTDNFTYTTTLLPPRNCTATAGYEKVTLGWDLNAAGDAVMVIRYAGTSPTITVPTDGTAYAADTSALGGTVVYGAYADPSGSATLDNVVSQGTGYTYVFYSVKNNKYSEGVVRTATTASLATPTVGVTTAGAGTLTGADAGKGEIYVVARIVGSGSFSGTPSGAAPNAGQPLCGGTVVYKGTAGSFSVADMEGCQTYQYKAWLHAADENAWSAGSTVATVSMPTPAAPVLNALSDVTYQGFTASWNAVPGAVTYRMDITTDGGGSTGLEASREFEDLATTILNGDSETVASLAWSKESAANAPAWYSEGVRMYAVSTGLGGSCTITPASGVTITKVKLTSSKTQNLNYYVNGGSMQTATSWSSSTMTFSDLEITSSGSFKFQNASTTTGTSGQLRITKIEIEYSTGSGGSSAVAGWTDKDVGSLMTVSGGVVSVVVEELDELTTYSVTVRAEGATAACASADSNTQSATTRENDTVTTVTISDADGAGNDSAVAAGNVAAGQTVLVQGTKLTVAAGSVTPTLTGVTFTTTGTAGTGDLATYQIRVGTSATFAGTETVKGTVTAGAAGSHTVTFGSAQTLTAGQTYYVWIEAVTKAGATGGNTVGVAALTKDSFATTGARKNGSTAATGLQTIGNLTAFSGATGASVGGQIDLTWTAGAGGTVTVRWSTSNDIPGPGTAWANEATGLTGGSHTLTGLTGCQAYYLKAWEVVGGTACGTALASTASASAPAAPTGLVVASTNAHGATLQWNAAAGATGYVIDLWHYEGDGGAGGEGIDGTYTEITSTADFTDGGYYVLVNSNNVAMNSTVSNSKFQSSAVEISGTTLTDPPAAAVWQAIEYDDGTFALMNASTETIATGSTSGTNVKLVGENDMETGSYWWVSCNGTTWQFLNDGVQTRALFASSDVWGNYGINNTGKPYSMPRVFKRAGGSGTRVDDVIAGEVQSGSSVTVTTSGTTGVNLGGLAAGTTYGWDVVATGVGGCEGDGATGPTFTTAELLGAPTINTPLTNGVEQLSGSITGAAGATMILKRYESEDAAMAATADGSLGGVVVLTTPGTGAAAGTWTFTDTGLDGCKTYYYRAWQKATVDGELATSAGSNVASGKTDLGTPTVSAVGAGTQLTVNWTAVPGATSYKVQISDTTNVWTATAGGEGTAVLTENFAGFTASDSTDISGSLDTYTTESGWTGTKVYSKDGSAKLGTSSLAGELTTPSLAAMTHGGRVYFDLQQYNSTDGGNLKVEQCIGTSTNWTTLKTFTPSEEWQTGLQADIPAGSSAFKLRFETTKKRAYIDNVRVVPLNEVPEGSGQGLIYESTVTSAPWSRTKTGLTIGQTYYYRVIATGGECETEAGGSALTADAPIIEVMPMHYNFGTVTKNEGAVTADFIVRNTGSIALKFSSVALVQDGDAYSITAPASGLTADLAAGESRTYTVTFNPTNSGLREATLRFVNDAYNVTGEVPPASGTPTYGNLDIPLTGTCYDPATADPTVYWLKVEDELGIEDTVTDHSMAHENDEPVLTVLTWHYNRSYRTLDRSAKATQWTLYDPNGDVVVTSGGTRLENQFFTDVEDYVYDGKTCAKFSVPIPALGTGKAVRGTYTVKIKVYDSTGTYCTETKEFLPIERGWLFEDFTRADREATGSGALENGWTAMVSGGAVVGEAAIHADALELYGANGECPGVAGRIAVARDMSDVGYATNPHEFVGTGSWGFHFRTGAKTVGFGDGSTAGAFVLGSTASTWLTATPGQVGYAVAMSNDVVQLVKFENSLLANGTITQLGEGQFAGTQGKLLAVRVDFLPGKDEVDVDESDDGQHHDAVPAKFQLYVKEVASTGGSPIEECTDADLVVEYALPGTEDHNLKFAGMMWNHGVAQVSDKTGAMFDDIYMPHMEGQTEPMMFHVIDEDTEAPTFYDFSILGAYAAQSIWDNGLVVTGYVHDASGIPSGSVTYTVYDGDEVLAGPEPMGVTAVDGSSTEFRLDCTIPAGLIPASIRSTACRFVVTATDGDDDRSEGGTNIDALTGTGSFPFTLCDTAPTAPAWATAEADGAEMVVLRWARTAGTQYIVVRSDEEIGDNSSPQGRTETMAEGTTVAGWGTVVYNGTGDNHLTGTWTAREFVVAPGSANYFAVYGMTGNGTTGYYFSAPTKPSDWSWTTGTGSEAVTTYATAACGEGAGRVPAGSPNGMPCMPSVTVRSNSWPVVTAKYEPGEGVDAFAYRTSVSYPTNNIAETPAELALAYGFETRTGTGSGWETNAPTGWQGDTNAWKIHDGSLLTGNTGYPTPTANKLYWQDTSKDWGTKEDMKLTRWLDAPESGDFFVAAILNFQYDGTGKWVTLSMVDEAGNDLVSFGKQGGDTDLSAAIMTPSTSPFGDNTRTNTNNGAAYTLTTGHGNDHIVIGQLSRTENKLRMWCYTGNLKIPEVFSKKTAGGAEVALGVATTAVNTVRADLTFDANLRVPDVAGIRLCAGSDIGVELGHVYFDEVRFAGTWEELLLFNDPEVEDYDLGRPTGSGMSNGTNSLGQTQWLVSDGALAHGNVGLNATFDLYHRTGIDSASFHILSSGASMTNLLRVVSGSATAAEGGTAANVTLTGTKGAVYGEWATPSGGATNVAMPTNWISLESNYVVEVSLRSSGGRESTSTSATDNMGGGATDLFFGEYGEGASWDKYVEIYNGTGRDIDLHNYYIVRPANAKSGTTVVNDFSTSYTNLRLHATAPYARLSSSSFVLHHKQTVVLLNDVNQPGHPDRLAKMKTELDKIRAKYLVMPKEVLDSNGSVPYLLVKAEDFDETAVSNAWKAGNRVTVDWLDACGCADGMGVDARYIMSRKPEAKHLPRSNPLLIDTNEWDFRRWSFPVSAVDDSTNVPPYTNFIATAGGYDRAIGLGGTMEFKVYDDDTDAPVLRGGGVSVGGTRRAAETGERVYVMGAWSFTNYLTGAVLTQEDYQRMASMWPMGMTTNGGISWSPLLGDNLSDVLEATSSSGQSGVDFDGLGQVKRGDMLAKASNRFSNEKEVWLGFDLDVAKLSDAVLTFGYAGGPNGFQNGRVEVSTTGLDGSFKMPNEWDFAPQSGTNATTWTEWSRDLADATNAVPEVATAGHLWFRVVLKNYKSSGGTFRMDNIRLEGAPEAVRVSDAELNTQTVAFDAKVLDEASGLDANTATFAYGVSGVTLTKSQSLVDGGKSESTFTWSKTGTGGFEKAKVQEWYEQSQAGKTQLRVTISDKDDDRAGDALEMSSSYGLLDVYDDDAEPPMLEMETMKPRKEGVFAEWKPKEKTQTPSETMAGLDVSALELFTTTGRTSKPRYAGMGDGETKTYALYANGWQVGSKYWTTTISNSLAGAGTISRISFDGKVGNVLAPTGFRVEYGTVAHGAVAAESTDPAGTGSLLTTGDAWSKENDAEAGGSPIKTWKTYELEFATPIPLAAAGEEGDVIELRIFGTGADPDGIGAYWYLYDLKLEGEITLAEDGYTYVTDDSLAGGTTLELRGSVYDEVSGLLAAPSFALTNVANSQVVSSGTISFSEEKDLSARKSKGDGAFSEEITLSSMGYGIQLAEYKGGIHAEDADDDRGTAGEDKLSLDAQFAFTVVDQDLVGPTAPANVTVNGVAVPQTAPNRNNVTWTNKPEFLVAFDVAHDEVPTAAQLGDADWLAAHGVAASSVKKASIQNVATGVGEYRVALATDAVSLSNAPAFSVAATNGALANYGFERGNKFSAAADTGWANTDEDSGINKGNNVGGSYPVAEGTNSYYLRANAVASQIIPFAASASAQTLTVDLSLKIFKRADGSIVYAKFEFSADEETWTSAITDVGLNTGADEKNKWLAKTMATKTLTAPAGAKYLRFSLRMNNSTANIDDVRLSVRVGSAPAAGTADRAMMRYVANAAAQGLNVKYLFAADADNNRVQDRRLGETATFYTAYDVTPPTAVQMNPESGASTEHVDDPTTQFDLTWNSSGVGPDDKDSPNGQAAGLTSNDALSPWYSYKIYYGAFDPEAWKGTTPASGASTTARLATRGGHVARATAYESLAAYINAEFIENEAYKTWNSVTRSSEVEDPSATGANYNTLGTKTTSSHRLYDLDFDQDYVVVIVGVDKAGNEGPATTTSWATNNTIKFAITQGVMRAEADIPAAWKSGLNGADRAAALYWTASASDGQVKRTYDLIYRDARSFNESSNNTWSLVGTVQSNWFVDAGALAHDAGRIRFYRAAYENRWKDKVEVSSSGRRGETEVVTQRPLMSEDVYAMTAVPLVEGMNYVSLHGFGVGNGETNTLGAIFGTDPAIWPVGTWLDVFAGNGYAAGTIGSNTASRTYVLQAKASGQTDWYRVEDGNVIELSTHVVNQDIFRHGVAINLPPITEQMRDTVITNNGTTYNAIYWHPVLLVPTNNYLECVSKSTDVQNQETTGLVPVDFTTQVKAGSGRTGAAWNLCAVNLPVACHPSQLGLERFFMPASGMHLTPDCDILYAYDSVTKSLRPGSGMFLGHASTNSTDTNLVWRSIIGNNPEVHGHPFYPNDMIVILSRGKEEGEQDWEWTYSPTDFYTAPTRWGGW